MEIPKIVLDYAEKHGFGDIEYVGTVNGSQVYGEVHNEDENGLFAPTGLPCFILLKDGKTECVDGLDALKLLGSL